MASAPSASSARRPSSSVLSSRVAPVRLASMRREALFFHPWHLVVSAVNGKQEKKLNVQLGVPRGHSKRFQSHIVLRQDNVSCFQART